MASGCLKWMLVAVALLSSDLAAGDELKPRRLDAAELAGLGFPAGRITARVNGHAIEMLAISVSESVAEVAARFRSSLLGRYTVIDDSGGRGRRFVVLDLRSPQCPTCFLSDTDGRGGEDSGVVAEIADVGSGTTVIYVSPVSQLRAAGESAGPLRYDGDALAEAPDDTTVLQAIRYQIGPVTVATTVFGASVPAASLLAELDRRLASRGYVRFGDGEPENQVGDLHSATYRHANGVVRISVTNSSPLGGAEVSFHEVSTR